MRPLDGLLFDVDGTLAETEELHRQAFNQAFSERGLDWHWERDLYRDLLRVAGGRERIRHYLQRFHPEALADPDIDRLIRELHARKTAIYTERVARGDLPLRPGVARLLEEARAAGLRLGIATTSSPENVEALLRANLGADALGWFTAIVAGDSVPRKKPAPDVYLRALEALGLSSQAALAFEDSDNGVRAARGAGLPVLVTVSDYTRGQDFSGADLVVDSLGAPGRPVRILSGQAPPTERIDLPFLREWFSRLPPEARR
ncbi:MAG: HAD family hydrolase [Gammaproteobacteria bacterium]|nr:MAG: HAD family hydrolase [Gammaproteobacteria bacterium]